MTRTSFALIIFALLGATPALRAQEATEMYIPIGRSPGCSHRFTVIGIVDSVNVATRTITVADSTGPHPFLVTEGTKLWLDRSGLRRPNVVAAWNDLRKGVLAEIRFAGDGARRTAEWIKVRVAP